jgi:hypothetical protein
VVGAVLGAAVAFGVGRRAGTAPGADGAVIMAGATFVLLGPSEPWYGLMLVALAVLAARPEWLLVSAAAYPVYNRLLLGPVSDTVMQQRCYLPAALVVLGVAATRWLRRVDGQPPGWRIPFTSSA